MHISDILKQIAKEPISKFRGESWYNQDGDCIVWFFSDSEHYAERINDKITIYRSLKNDKIVGCQIKGIDIQNGSWLKMKEKLNLKNGERVAIKNLGDGRAYPGTVVGKGLEHIADSYVIKTDGNPFSDNYEYDCVIMSEFCLERLNISKETSTEFMV